MIAFLRDLRQLFPLFSVRQLAFVITDIIFLEFLMKLEFLMSAGFDDHRMEVKKDH